MRHSVDTQIQLSQMMKTLNRHSSFMVTLLSLFLSFIGWMTLAPTQLGGSVTYVIVDGNSMEPGFHLGDLLLVRTEASYRVGDAVIYQNAELGRFVFHRIIGAELDRFTLQGDNNSWVDSYHPSQDEIVGKLWIHIPKLGRAIKWVRLPINLALTIGLLGGVLMPGMIMKKPPKHGEEKYKAPGMFGRKIEGLLYLTGFLTLAFLALSIFTFTRPLTRNTENIPYQQEAYFFYSAKGTPGVYDSELVRSGEPVFPKLTCILNIGFTYNLLATQLQEASGSYQLYARVFDSQSGWQRTIPLTPQTTFKGNTYSSVATLDLCQVESMANLVEQETGLNPNTYTLEIISHLEITGIIAGNQISDTFDPSLVFEFDKVHFYLNIEDTQTDPLHSVKQGMAGSSDLQTNTFSILGLEPTVRSIRLISLLFLGFSLTGLVITGLYVYKKTGQSQDARIRLRYGAMLVDIYEQNLKPSSSVFDVTTIDDLARLAERHGTMILHMKLYFLHFYLVQSNEITYRYVISTGKEGLVETEPVHNKTPEQMIGHDENKAVNFDAVRRDEVVHQINSHKNKYIDAKPFREETVEYVINTGKIGFVMHESESAKILRRIKL